MVAELIEDAAVDLPDLDVDEIDVTQRSKVAVKYQVVSTPAVAINGRLEFVGIPRREALLERLRIAARGMGQR